MLGGEKVNLRLAEKEDVPLLVRWFSDVRFAGDYEHFPVQVTKEQLEKQVVERKLYEQEWVDFIIEKKNGTGIGWAAHYISAPNFGWTEIGYAIVPEERGKGYGTEAIQILVDYLFLSRDIARVQAVIDSENLASRRALEKAGFKKEGTIRKALWNAKGKWADGCLFAILREEWKEPRVLAKTSRRGHDK